MKAFIDATAWVPASGKRNSFFSPERSEGRDTARETSFSPLGCLCDDRSGRMCRTSSVKQPTASQLSSGSYETLYLGANGQVVSKTTQAGKKQDKGYWNGAGMTGSPSIVINLSTQEAYFYKGGKLVGMSPVSTGARAITPRRAVFMSSRKTPTTCRIFTATSSMIPARWWRPISARVIAPPRARISRERRCLTSCA